MKSVKFSALMAVAVIAASCAKEGTHSVDESDKVALEPMCIEASDESQTKTVLVEKSVNWTDGDKIAVYSNINYNKGYIFPATDIKGNSATFNGEVPVGTESFFAVYPPERVVSVNKDGVTVNIPAEQTPAAGTFAEEHNITVAQGTKTPGVPSVGTITFNNVCSYVKFTVPAYVSDVNKVTITSGNAIAGDFATASSKIVSNGTNSISMKGSFGAGKTFLFVIAPGTVSNFSIYIETASGNWTRTVSNGFEAKAGVPVKLGTVDFKIASMDAEVKHTYDGKTLTGTNLVIKNLNIPDHLTGYVKKVHIDIIPEGPEGQTTADAVRSADITDFSTQTSIAVNSTTYPYLPQGKYTIKSTYTMSDGTTSRETTGSFSVPAPKFSVDASLVRTSYDTYLTSGADAANKMDGSTIYILNNGVTIHSDILKKYKNLSTVSHTIDGYPVTVVDDNGNATYQTGWREHTVVVKFTFDGVNVESTPLTRHVTGLPCTLQPNKTDWTATAQPDYVTFGKDSFGNDCIQLKGNYITPHPKIQSKSFNIPSDINISTDFSFYISVGKRGLITYKSTLNEYIGGNYIKVYQRTSSGSETRPVSINGDLTSSKPYIEFEAETTTSSNSDSYSRIYTVNLNYGAPK